MLKELKIKFMKNNEIYSFRLSYIKQIFNSYIVCEIMLTNIFNITVNKKCYFNSKYTNNCKLCFI